MLIKTLSFQFVNFYWVYNLAILFQNGSRKSLIIYHRLTSSKPDERSSSKLLLLKSRPWAPNQRLKDQEVGCTSANRLIIARGRRTSQRASSLPGRHRLNSHTPSSHYPRLIRMPRRECYRCRPVKSAVLGNNRFF